MKEKGLQLFICRSPFQLLNCIEAHHAFASGSGRSLLLAGHVSERDRIMMAQVLDQYGGFSETALFPLYPFRQRRMAMRSLLGKRTAVARLFVGDTTQYQNLIINRRLRRGEIWMVDDGASTLSRLPLIASRTLHKYRKNLAPQGWLVSSLKRALGLDASYLYDARFFSMYDLSPYGLESRSMRNEFAWLSSRLAHKPVGDEVWFIGSNFAGDLLAHAAHYPDLLVQLARHEDMRKLVYIPHRKESDSLLQTLATRLGFRIRRFENILELALVCEADALPARVVSFGSSAVNTLHRLIARPTTLYSLQAELIAPSRLAVVEAFFAEAESSGFETRALFPSMEGGGMRDE